jgi:UDP-N-acetylmuramate dehydrogenase
MILPDAFAEIAKPNEPLGPYTTLRVGGCAEFLLSPRSIDELAAVFRHAWQEKIPVRVIGIGSNLLVKDEGVAGFVIRLVAAAFTRVEVENQRVRAGAGAFLSAIISEATRHGLAGLETLVGIPATVGGAVRCNAGDRSGEIGTYVRRVQVLNDRAEAIWREHAELRFSENDSNLDDPVILSAEFELDPDRDDAIVKRMRKAWIQRKAAMPHSFQAHGRMFKNPRGLNAAALIEAAGLAKTRVGGAEICERNANYVVTDTGATARDVLRLIELVRSKVKEQSGIELDREILVW